ncbi:MAG: peptidoglycan DD-metalloendopeptidase family protein [Fimbriimonadaceae bacterium]|nr:peptidoglycan DD-metalloendopeptidase family protein [Chitinophagales bacterium]
MRNFFNGNLTPAILIFISILLIPQKEASAQADKKTLQNKYEKLQDEIKDTEDILSDTKKKKQNSINEVKLIKRKIEMREEMIKNISQQVSAAQNEMQETQQQINSMEKDLGRLKDEYAKMIYYAYVNESDYQPIHFILASKSLSDAIHEIEYVRSYTSHRKQQLTVIADTQKELVENAAKLASDKVEKENLLGKEKEQKNKLTEEKSEKDNTLKNLQGKEKELAVQIDKKKKDAKDVNKKIQNIISEEIKKEKEKAEAEAKKKKEAEKALAEKKAAEKKTTKETKSTETKTTAEKKTETVSTEKKTTSTEKVNSNLTPEAALASKNFEGNKGKLPWPVERGSITERFGTHEHPVLNGVMIENNGIDITTTEGASVRSIFEGEVVNVIFNPSFQKGVIIKHGNYYTVYTHMNEVTVSAGQKISTKQKIGTAFTDDEEGKTEVHLEIWKGTVLMDPVGWISKL